MLEQNVLNMGKHRVKHNGTSIFHTPLTAMRYHSLVAAQTSLPECFDILATAMDDGEIMAVRHNYYPLFGLQFHPESIARRRRKVNMCLLTEVKERRKEYE